MDDRAILEKAVTRATANGFDMDRAMGRREPNNSFRLHIDPRLTYWSKYENGESMVYWLIFNHDFAKALWGESPAKVKNPVNSHIVRTDNSAWQYYLQMMAVSDDPIKYLGEHL